MSLSITTNSPYHSAANTASFETLDILRHESLILPRLEELHLFMECYTWYKDRANQAFRDLVHMRKDVIKKICVYGTLGSDLIGYLSDNVPCVMVSS
jgi:hypothetical protein